MPMGKEDYDVLMKHIKAKFKDAEFIERCPACHVAGGWVAEGPVVQLRYSLSEDNVVQTGPGGMPVAILICRNCHYTLQFAWNPIRMANA
jgi:hypothetical protein